MKAFMYSGRSFLFPDGISDESQLRELWAEKGSITLTELVEELCMTPYFVSEHTKEESVAFEEKCGIYPFEAELMTMKEYNLRLREMLPVLCSDCPYFSDLTDDDDSLDGHHEEAALNGVCFIRNEAECEDSYAYSPLDIGIEVFVKTFGKLNLEELIDSGEVGEATDKLWNSLNDELFPPDNPLLLDHPEGGKYRLVYTSLFNQTDAILWEAVLELLAEEYGDTWEFYNYIPKGVYPVGAKKPLGIVLEESYTPIRKDIKIYTDGNNTPLYYIWLCGLVGEDRLGAAIACFDFIPVEGELPENAITVEEFASEVAEQTAEYEKDQLIVPYPDVIPFIPEECSEDAPEEEIDRKIRMYSVRSRELFHGLLMLPYEAEERNDVWNEESNMFFSATERAVAKLVFKDPPMNGLSEYKSEKMANFNAKTAEFLEYLKKKNLVKLFNQCISADMIELCMIVMNLRGLLYEVRRISPILSGIDAELEILSKDGLCDARYKIGFDMEKIEE